MFTLFCTTRNDRRVYRHGVVAKKRIYQYAWNTTQKNIKKTEQSAAADDPLQHFGNPLQGIFKVLQQIAKILQLIFNPLQPIQNLHSCDYKKDKKCQPQLQLIAYTASDF